MASSDKELEQQLLEAGNKLSSPPSSVDELLPLLDQVENCLSKVEQSPTKSMQSALAPSQKALVADQLFRHSDVDVKVAVACCISEITRITAPDAPYDDDQMKDVFQLIVSSFENLCDKSSRSYSKRTSILETVAKVRSCVVMLDLECDALINKMFQHFLNAIRDHHPENVFLSMETIMILVLEESEEISQELLSTLLASMKRGNEEALLVARKLGEKVLGRCANKVRPYLQQAVKSLVICLDDYSDVVASICQEISGSVGQSDAPTADENKVEESKPVGASTDEPAQAGNGIAAGADSPKLPESANDKSPKSVVSNGVAQTCEDDPLADSSSLKKVDDGNHTDQSKSTDISSNVKPDIVDAEKLVDDENKLEEAIRKTGKKENLSTKSAEPSESSHICTEKEAQELLDDKTHSKDVPSSPREEPAVKGAVSSENKEEADATQPPSPKAQEGEGESVAVASPSESENLPEETLTKKTAQSKKETSTIDSEPSPVDASRKAAEGTSNSEAKPSKRSRKTPSRISNEEKTHAKISNEEKTAKADASKKETDIITESEAKPLKQSSSKKVDANRNNGDGSSIDQFEDKKQRSRGKSISEKKVIKSSAKDDDKVSTPKSAAKLTRELHQLETPKTDSKRKRASANEKESKTNDGADLVGLKVRVWWPKDRQFYEGRVDSYDAIKKKHRILYDDGDEENLNLAKQKWEIIQDDSMQDEGEAADLQSPDVPSEKPPKKKAKTNIEQSAKQDKAEASKGGGASSSKSKSQATKSGGQKSKESGKTDSKSTDDSKAAKKAEDDNVGKIKDNANKSGSKSADVTPKMSSKSKNDVSTSKSGKSKEDGSKMAKTSNSKQESTRTGKSKQDTPKVISNAKNKSSKSGGKSSVNGSGKLKSGASKVKETEGEDMSTDSGKPQESTKGKSQSSSSKGQGSEVKSGKKRRRV